MTTSIRRISAVSSGNLIDDRPKTEYDEIPKTMKFILLFEGTGNHDSNPSAIGHLYDMLKDTRTQRKHIVSGSGTHGIGTLATAGFATASKNKYEQGMKDIRIVVASSWHQF